ncbi:MAG: FAD-binding oxidoreductase [Candidatus Marinimicrobia bacterium]|nr:FAD-binding oxidoreductase [Candidatus Neomarinimicrobiota bacterium]
MTLADSSRADSKTGLQVAVVGAGIVGASIAYHLAQRGALVTIVDSGQPGFGASSHSFAWINAGHKSPAAYHDLNRRSLEMWDRFAQRLGGGVGLRWGGKLSWESTSDGAAALKERVRQLQEWGYPTRLLDEAELHGLAPELSLGTVTAAEFSEIEGQVEPQMVVDACLRGARELGAKLVEGVSVTGFTRSKGSPRVEGLETGSGSLPCDVGVLAAGVNTTELAAKAGIHVPQEESPGVVIRTGPRPRLLPTVPVVYAPALDTDHPDSVRGEIHLRQCHDGTFMIGEGNQESLLRDDTQAHADDLLGRAIHYLPSLAGAQAITVPVGYRPMPLDGYPILGFPATGSPAPGSQAPGSAEAAPNVYIALTHSGVTLAPVIGELAALEIMDGVRVESLSPYRPERFL